MSVIAINNHQNNQTSHKIVCGVPRTGRTLELFLKKLKPLVGKQDLLSLDSTIAISQISKQLSTNSYSEIQKNLTKISRTYGSNSFGIFIDRKRKHRPYRIGFLSQELAINGLKLSLEGDESHNCASLVRLEEFDMAVVGLDELLTSSQSPSDLPVTKWGMYNFQLPRYAKMRIAGSCGLDYERNGDFVGFFLISKNQGLKKHASTDPHSILGLVAENKHEIFVKGRYADIIESQYDLKVNPVENVEEAVLENHTGAFGIEIIQSGGTISRQGLYVLGAPLFMSESIYAVNYREYRNNPHLQTLLISLKPVEYFDAERIDHFADWYRNLSANLGAKWINPPSAEELLISREEENFGLNPYRLESRYWIPDSTHKSNQAIIKLDQAKDRIRDHFLN